MPLLRVSQAAAYQLINSGSHAGECFALTGDLTVAGAFNVTPSFFDGKNVARGWQQKIPGGAGTNCPGFGQSRSFTFVHMCDRTTPTPPTNPGNFAFIDEISGCNYAAFMYSQLGCATRACLPPSHLHVRVPHCATARRPTRSLLAPAFLRTMARRVPRDGQGRVQQRGRVRL